MAMVFTGLGFFCGSVIVFALTLLLKGDGSRDQKLMQFFLFGSLIQNAGYILELMAPTMEAALVAVKVQYMGSLLIPISYCYFLFSYCYEKTPARILRLIKVIDGFVFILVFTSDQHHLYYRQIEWLHAPDGHGYLSLSYGPGYWLFMICGTVIPYMMSLYALIRVCIRKPEHVAERKYKVILVLSVFPIFALCCYSLKLVSVYDPTPFVLGMILSIVALMIWLRKVYDFSSLASGILLDSMSDGVIALDERQKIVSYNPAAARIFPGLEPSMIGVPVGELEGFPGAGEAGESKEEFALNGRFYQCHMEPILDQYGGNKGHVALILDVTETRTYIEEIKRVRKQAEQANIAKSAFLANMSHEIRTPMNAIVGLSDIIVEESRGRKVYEYACDIKAAAKNLLTLINDILDLSKVEAGKMELSLAEYHLKELLTGVVNMMDVVASRRGLLLKSEYDLSVPCRYLGDSDRIKQVLINILNNGLKFTKEGHVKISVSGRRDTEDVERLTFRIEDTGCGIRQEELAGIFDNFRQVDLRRNRSVEGTGLGLSITKQLVELMQGEIRVESVYGEGTVFTVEIPQKIVDFRSIAEAPETEGPKEQDLEPFLVEGYKVLVVDDNRINRKVANIFLRSYGFLLDEAESGQASIDLVKKNRYDMIFMDHMMPEMDGIEAVQRIRTECGENGTFPVVVALTANAMSGVKEHFLQNGFQDFLTKPIDRKSLHETLMRWIPKERRTVGKVLDDNWQVDNQRNEAFQKVLIEWIDTDEVVRRYSGSVEDYLQLLELYCLDGKRKIPALKNLWEQGDYKTYGIEVHALKSASANVGAMRVSSSARDHENAVKRGDKAFVDANVAQLLEDYAKQVDYIQNFVKRTRKRGAGAEKGAEVKAEELLREIREALASLEKFRSRDCADRIGKLLERTLPEDVESKLTEVAEQLKLYEDEAAENLLRALIAQIGETGLGAG